MSPEVLIFIVGAVITVIGSYFAAKVAGKASVRVAEVSADEGAYVRAQGIYEKVIEQLQNENSQERRKNAELRKRVIVLEHRVRVLEGKVNEGEDLEE
jgi:hypothetical protein